MKMALSDVRSREHPSKYDAHWPGFVSRAKGAKGLCMSAPGLSTIATAHVVLLQGARGLEKGKGQLAKQQEKRKRAEDKASAPKKCACTAGQTNACLHARTTACQPHTYVLTS